MATEPSIGTAIKRARERMRWSQRQLATALHVSIKTVDNWENDRTYPRNAIGAIEQVLGISLSGGEAEPQHPGLPPLIRDNYGDEAVRLIWSRERISRDARLGLVAWYVALRDEANGT